MGEIAGEGCFSALENCVSAGNISSNTKSKYIGAIVGSLYESSLSNCYWNEYIDFNIYGSEYESSISECSSFNSNTFLLHITVSIGGYKGDSLIKALNAYSDYYFLHYYSHWVLNRGENSVVFTVNSENKFTVNNKVILLPNLANEGKVAFDRWYTDTECTTPLTNFEIGGDITLYGKFEENYHYYTITFETRDGIVVAAPITAQYFSFVTLPKDIIREGCAVTYWENENEETMPWEFTMPAYNITLYPVWLCIHIKDANELIDFSKSVNSGTSYSGTTVFLDSDIDFTEEFSQQFESIGKDPTRCFLGTFDGQGHVISNLVMNSSSQYVGLFGYSEGLIIQNVVIDSSCSITSFYADGDDIAYIGGVIGKCDTINGLCIVQNNVNMANIVFNGNSINYYILYLGGISGYLFTSNYETFLTNCANYGSITHTGRSVTSFIGGIVGRSHGVSSSRVYIQNSLNHGAVTNNGETTDSLYMGGIVGDISYSTIENCVSAGSILNNTQINFNTYIGGIVGSSASSNALHTFWTSVLTYPACENGDLAMDNETSQVELNLEFVNKLRSYSTRNNSWSKWLLNTNGVSVAFRTDERKELTIKSQVVLLPDLADNGGYTFLGWYKDAGLTDAFTDSEVNSSTTLYGTFVKSKYVVTFDVNGGDEFAWNTTIVTLNSIYGKLPTPTRVGHAFVGWFTDKNVFISRETIVSTQSDHTLYAHWVVRRYTVLFDINGGDTLEYSEKVVTFNSTYGPLPKASRNRHDFIGWFTDKNESVTSKSIVNIPSDHILHAEWEEIQSKYVEIIFGGRSFTEEEVEDIVNQYTNAKYTVTKFGNYDPDGTRVIIRFNKMRDAVNFVEAVREMSDSKTQMIVSIGYAPEESFSSVLYPVFLLYLISFFM